MWSDRARRTMCTQNTEGNAIYKLGAGATALHVLSLPSSTLLAKEPRLVAAGCGADIGVAAAFKPKLPAV